MRGIQGGTIGAIEAGHWLRRVRKRDAIGYGYESVAGVQNGRKGFQNHLLQVVGVDAGFLLRGCCVEDIKTLAADLRRRKCLILPAPQ